MNCKPGDLAIIVRQSEGAPNLGRIVEVREYHGEHGTGRWPCWIVQASAPLNSFKAGTRTPSKSLTGIIPDAWLRPISGVPVTDDVRDEVLA